MTGKCCGLGPAGFPHGLRCVAAPAVSLYGRAAVLPPAGLDYHLVHTIIPVKPLANSLGIFFNNTPSPSLFCRRGFRSRLPRFCWPASARNLDVCVHCFFRHTHSRQATLHPTPHHVSASSCRSSLRRSPVARIGATATCAGLLGKRVVARMPLRIALPPGGIDSVALSLSRIPSTSPRLGIGSQHQRPHRCALDGFLGPPSEKVVLTRILRHQKR